MTDQQASSAIPPKVAAKLDELRRRREDIERGLADPEVLADHNQVRELSVAKAALDPLVDRYDRLLATQREADELRAARSEDDPELAAMARDELPRLEERAQALVDEILEHLVTAEDHTVGSVILEIRSGVGGDEAALWAGDLLSMYEALARRRGWSFEVMDAAPGEVGGVRHAVAAVSGENAWSELAHEAGTHCVKRVPATEAQGRIHTSTATVAALPEPRAVEVHIDPTDVEEHITTAQGPGGQNVNKVATAVHLRHIPSGVEVRMQESKSQRQNREKAWRLLRARLHEMQREKEAAERAETRQSQIGGAARAERIRTYRYKDNIAVDHRVGESFSLEKVLAGDLDDLSEALRRQDVAKRLADL